MGFLSEFKEFAVKGNVMDMAVGVIIGGAFGKIITSLVSDVIMPPIGLALGGMDFSKLALTLKEATATSEAVVISYGKFIMAYIDFLIIAFVIFMMIKAMNSLKHQKEAAPAAPPKEELLLTEIRDILKKK
jgi:large conductance mechanosensitive channel